MDDEPREGEITMRKWLVPVLAVIAWSALRALAQGGYPERPITVIVPQAAGGANDTIARIIAQRLAQVLKQPIVIENRAGAGGNIGTVVAAKAKPDGYTLMITTNGTMVINPSLYSSTGFDPIKDFEPIGTVATAGYVLVTNPSYPAKDVKELVAQVKKQAPGTVTYASAGNGTLNHLIMAMLEKTADVQMVHIPYKSAAASATDVVGGQVPISVQSVPSSIGFIQSGKLKLIAIANERRIAAFPDTPSIGETYPGFGATPWYGLFAPAGTPKPIVDRLAAALDEALDSKDVKDSLAAQGCEPLRKSPADFTKLMQADLPMWSKIVKESGAKVD
jgi:tripartite-type tricarboxylate transporter receptor subunit TctC